VNILAITHKNGFGIGIVAALLIHLGIMAITMVEHTIAIVSLLLFAAFVTYKRKQKNASVFNPAYDGFIEGFGWVFGLIGIYKILITAN
jgi:hypothetical protein